MIGRGEGNRAQRHVEDIAVKFDVGGFSQLIGGQVGKQALGVLADAGQCPAQLRQRGFGLGVRQCHTADGRDRQLGRDLSAEQHELRMQPALGVDDMQEDLANRPFSGCEAVAEAVVGACVKQNSQLVEVLLERSLHIDGCIYKINDDVYLNLFPA